MSSRKQPGESRIVRTVRDGQSIHVGHTRVKVQRRRGRIKVVLTGPASVRYQFPRLTPPADSA